MKRLERRADRKSNNSKQQATQQTIARARRKVTSNTRRGIQNQRILRTWGRISFDCLGAQYSVPGFVPPDDTLFSAIYLLR